MSASTLDEAIALLEPIVLEDARDWRSASDLRRAHRGKAQALGLLNRHDNALVHWERTITLDDPQYRHWYLMQRARTLARLGETDRAVEEAEAMAAAPEVRSGSLYDAACVLALVAAGLPADDEHRADFIERAIELLRQALLAGYDEPEKLRTDSELDAIRPHDDFQALLAGLRAE